MSDQIETVKIKSSHPKSQGDFVEINKSDFDPKKHTLFAGNAPAVPPPPAAVDPNAVPPAPTPFVNATKKAAALAADAGLDLASVVGTGENGKITIEDVESAIEKLTNPENDDK